MPTPTKQANNLTQRMNRLRVEAKELWECYSPTRQSWYIEYRMQGYDPKQAIELTRQKGQK